MDANQPPQGTPGAPDPNNLNNLNNPSDPTITAAGSSEASATPAAEPPPPTLEEQLAAAQAKATEHYDAFLRSRADAENIRKRAQEDITKAHKYGIESFAQELLPVRDSVEAALATENATVEIMRSGVELTLKQLVGVFEKSNLKEINPVGEKFDPHKHQAISMLPSEKEPGTVINVLQKGYLLADRVIRPALVTVAKATETGASA
jgi:molecular chaperone GrpE